MRGLSPASACASSCRRRNWTTSLSCDDIVTELTRADAVEVGVDHDALCHCPGRAGQRGNQPRKLLEPWSEEVVQRGDGDLRLALLTHGRRRGGESVLEEAIEALLAVPDLDDSKAEVGRVRDVLIDPGVRP